MRSRPIPLPLVHWTQSYLAGELAAHLCRRPKAPGPTTVGAPDLRARRLEWLIPCWPRERSETKIFSALSDQLVSAIAKSVFCLRVNHDNRPSLLDDHQRIRRCLEQGRYWMSPLLVSRTELRQKRDRSRTSFNWRSIVLAHNGSLRWSGISSMRPLGPRNCPQCYTHDTVPNRVTIVAC